MRTEDIALLAELRAAGSISRLARQRAVAVSTLTRRLAAMEHEFGLTLAERLPDGIRLTAEGARLAALGAPLLAAAQEIAHAAEAMRAGWRQAITISATETMIAEVLTPALPRLWAAMPGLPLDLRAEAGVVSLAGREADLAIRMSRPEGASLVTRKLGEIRLGLFAAPALLGGREPAALPLGEQRLAVYDDSYGRLPELGFLAAERLSAAVAFRSNSTRALLQAATSGACVALLPRFLAREAGLVELPLPFSLPVRSPWLVLHPALRRRRDITAVRRWVVEAFAARLGAG